MARQAPGSQQPVRKSLLIIAGVAVGAALLGFVLMNFVLGGGGGNEQIPPAVSTNTGGVPAVTPSPSPSAPALKNGGRDPFKPQGLGIIITRVSATLVIDGSKGRASTKT